MIDKNLLIELGEKDAQVRDLESLNDYLTKLICNLLKDTHKCSTCSGGLATIEAMNYVVSLKK